MLLGRVYFLCLFSLPNTCRVFWHDAICGFSIRIFIQYILVGVGEIMLAELCHSRGEWRVVVFLKFTCLEVVSGGSKIFKILRGRGGGGGGGWGGGGGGDSC